jgi:hypothetical protein
MKAPDQVTAVLWEGEFQTPLENEVVRAERGGAGTVVAPTDLPLITIGKPETWQLTELYSPSKMPAAIKAKLDTDDFYLIRFCCSLRTREKESAIDFARFQVDLKADKQGRQPIAFDLHPVFVNTELKRSVKVGLSPSVKFTEIEASIGGVDFGIEYTELQPVISANGIGEALPSWDFSSTKSLRLQGVKCMHAVVRAAKGTSKGAATIDVSADVRVKGSLLSVLLRRNRKQLEQDLTVRLW